MKNQLNILLIAFSLLTFICCKPGQNTPAEQNDPVSAEELSNIQNMEEENAALDKIIDSLDKQLNQLDASLEAL